MKHWGFIVTWTCLLPLAASSQQQVLYNAMHHLRNGSAREWSSFPEHAKDSQLTLTFNLQETSAPATILLRQADVLHDWKVSLNGRSLGNLTVDEKDMLSYFEIPQGVLHNENTLTIHPLTKATSSDDISVGEIALDRRPLHEILSDAEINIEVRDNQNNHLPSRITIVNNKGVLHPVNNLRKEHAAVRTGTVYSGDGVFSFSIPEGSYTIYAGRGFEYSVDSMSLNVNTRDRMQKRMTLTHQVPARDWVSTDPHIHTVTFSGHGDATVNERVITIAGEGLAMPVITDHNIAIDISDTVRRMGMTRWFTPITGNEVTTPVGHFNIFPVSSKDAVPDHRVTTWNDVANNITQQQRVQTVILNHARDIHNGFIPFDTAHHVAVAGKSFLDWQFPANAMEIMNSGSQQTDPRELYYDWLGMLNGGQFITPVGSSDSHDVWRFIVGQARTYVKASKDTADFIKNFSAGRTTVSFGLMTEMIIDSLFGPGEIAPSGDRLHVHVKVWGPDWARADRLMIFVNGEKVRHTAINDKGSAGLKWEEKFMLPRPQHDIHVVAVAEGPGINAPYWPIAKPFQPRSADIHPIVLGVTNAIRIDADNDGKFTSAYEYAKQLWDSCGGNLSAYVKRLAGYHQSVSIQAGRVLAEGRREVLSPQIQKIFAQGRPHVRNGFKKFTDGFRKIRP